MKHFRSGNSLAVIMGVLVLASLACSLTNRAFQPGPVGTRTTSATASKTLPKGSSTPTRKVTPTHRIPAAFLKLTANEASSGQSVSPHLATITPLPGPTEELGNEVIPTDAIPTEVAGTDQPEQISATRTKTPVPVHTSIPTQTVNVTQIATEPPVPNATATAVPACGSAYNAQNESDLLDWINGERQGQGLKTLNRSKKLDKAALRHSLDMACTQDWFDQKGSKNDKNSTIFDRIVDAGYNFSRADETIYAASGISDNPKSAFDTWKSLPTSKAIMFDPNYTDIGIGYVNNPNSTYGGYFTAVFAQP
jgi:uncharacterized protein YkwD